MKISSPKILMRIEPWVLVVVVLATFLRVYRLNEFPPALYWDEAFDGYDALRVVQTPSHPIFFEGDTGREPLTIYLQALGIIVWGNREWTLRIVPALLGIVTIPALYRMTRTWFNEDARAKEIGLLAAGMLAVSFWHVDLSRLSLRAIAYPLLGVVTLWLFWRAWQTTQFRYFASSGVALGLTLYTYLAARLLPVVLIAFVFVVGLLALRRPNFLPFNFRRVLLGLGVLLATMALVFIPIGIYFWNNPGAFFLRASYISIFSGDARGWATLPYTILTTLRMFIDHGDTEIIRNLPGLPAFDPLMAFGFLIGLVIALVRLPARPVYSLLLLWFVIDLAPTFFSVDIPNFMRTSTALVAALVIASDGWSWLRQRLAPRLTPVALFGGVVAIGGVLTFNNYFSIWGPAAFTYDYFNGARRTIVERAIAESRQADVILPLDLYATANAQFYLSPYFSPAQPLQPSDVIRSAIWLTPQPIGRDIVILRKDGHVLVPQPFDDARLAHVGELLKNGQPLIDPFGRPIATEFNLDDPSNLFVPLNPTHPSNVIFGGRIKLLGYDLDSTPVAPGNKVRVTYYWQALTDIESDYWVVSTLLDPAGNAFGKRISEPVDAKGPTSLWRHGITLLDSWEFTVPATAHFGDYRFELALINPIAPDQPLAISVTEDRLVLDPFVVAKEPVNASVIAHPLALKIGEPTLMTFLGYAFADAAVKPGSPLSVTLYWKAEAQTPTDYSVFLHLLDAAGKIVAQQDGPPQNGAAPTSWWRPGDLVADSHSILVAPETQPGQYTLEFGVYDSSNGSRLPMIDPVNQRGDALKLPVTIVAR